MGSMYRGCQLAARLDGIDRLGLEEDRKVLLEPKVDGARCVVVDGVAYSRLGNAWFNLDPLVEKVFGKHSAYVFDCELMYNDTWGETSSALHRKTLTKQDLKQFKFHAFDLLTDSEYQQGGTNRVLVDRRAELKELVEEVNNPQLVLMPSRVTAKQKVVEQYFEHAIEEGGEGIMIKDLNSGYAINSRTRAWLKVKRMETEEGVIIALNEGNGKMSGMVGTLSVMLNSGEVVKASGRMDYALRRKMLRWPKLYIGKHIEIEFQDDAQRVANKRFRQVVRFRPDLDAKVQTVVDQTVKARPEPAGKAWYYNGCEDCDVITIGACQ